MLEMIMDRHLLSVLLGIVAAAGLISKVITGVTLKKLVHAAANMGKSTHPLMRLIRAKYEHTCMVSDRVQNVEVFVEKYICEYRIAGLPLHSWQRMERGASWLCMALGVLAAAGEYVLRGMNEQVLRNAVLGLAAGIILFVLRVSLDENYRMQVIRTYMVDYLDNFCARKYEKNLEKKNDVKAEPEKIPESVPVTEPEKTPAPVPAPEPEKIPAPVPVTVPATEPEPDRPEKIRMAEEKKEGQSRQSQEKTARQGQENAVRKGQEKIQVRQGGNISQEMLIREILEEYLA